MNRTGWIAVAAIVLLVAGCAAGPGGRWAGPEVAPAGFWAGLWHGLLLVISLIVSFFTDAVRIYEVRNTGVAYDIGFVLGVLAMSSSGVKVTLHGKGRPKKKVEPDEIADRIERKVKVKLKAWLEEDDEWRELGEQAARKLKEKLRRWLDEDEGGRKD